MLCFESTFCIEVELPSDIEAIVVIRTSVDPGIRPALVIKGLRRYVEDALSGLLDISGNTSDGYEAIKAAQSHVATGQSEG